MRIILQQDNAKHQQVGQISLLASQAKHKFVIIIMIVIVACIAAIAIIIIIEIVIFIQILYALSFQGANLTANLD